MTGKTLKRLSSNSQEERRELKERLHSRSRLASFRETSCHTNESGFALITVFFLLTLLASILGAYTLLTQTDLKLVKASKDSASGFNAAEAGLNLRAAEIRSVFFDFANPAGVSPSGLSDCDNGTLGSGDFKCTTYPFQNRHTAVTFITEDPNNPIETIVPPGEPFEGLNAKESRYTTTSVGRNADGSNEAVLEMTFKSRSIPLFQFAAVFEEDLEFFNGGTMSLDGPLHSNSDMYLAAQNGGQLNLGGQVTVAKSIYTGRKSEATCSGYSGTVSAKDPASYLAFPACSGSRSKLADVSGWNEEVIQDMGQVQMPAIEDFESFGTSPYWRLADVRIALRLDASNEPDTGTSATGIEIVDNSGNKVTAATVLLNNSAICPGSIDGRSVGTSDDKLTQHREKQYDNSGNAYQNLLEVDLDGLLDCLNKQPSIIGGKDLDDDSDGGLVLFFAIDGPDSGADHNNYGVRIRDASELQADAAGAPAVRGLTVVSDQGVHIWGNYNSVGWIPSAILSDSLYLLSNNWVDSNSSKSLANRVGTTTTVNAAVLTGVARTGGANGPAGQDKGADTNGGGVINIFRFNEWWQSGSDFNYTGSIASLGAPKHSQSTWGPFNYYSAPDRIWAFDIRFNDPDNLPPLSPTLVYLKQEVFVRDYEVETDPDAEDD